MNKLSLLAELGQRQFEPITLSAEDLDQHAATVFMAARSHKAMRQLAIAAKSRLRHLVDMAALEACLDQAVRYEMSGEGSAADWLKALIGQLDFELAKTLREHRILADRIAARTSQIAMARTARGAR